MLKNIQSRPVAWIILLFIVIFAQFYGSLAIGFLGWDDTAYLQDDAIVSKGLTLEGVRYAFSTFSNPYYMPITRLSYMLDVSMYGISSAWGFRLTNIILHSVNCAIIFMFLLRCHVRQWLAFAGAAIFALHPQHVEAVVWIAGRKELLAGLFGLLSLLAYQQYTVQEKKEWYLVTVLAFGLSLMNKPIWIALPFLFLLLDYYPFNRFSFKANVKEKASLMAMSVSYAVVFTNVFQLDGDPVSYFPEDQGLKKLWLPLIALKQYIQNTIWPVNLLPYYPFPETISSIEGMSILIAVLGILLILWKFRQQNAGLFIGVLWFGMSLAAALKITVFPQGEAMFIGDRYSYLPHIGFIIGLLLSLNAYVNKHSTRLLSSISVALVMMLLVFSVLSQQVIRHWQNTETLWKYTASQLAGKGQAYPLGMLGQYYQGNQQYEEALIAFKQAHQQYKKQYIYPLLVRGLYNEYLIDYGLASEWENKLLDEAPAPADVLLAIGGFKYLNNDTKNAERFLRKALQRAKEKQLVMPEVDVYLGLTLLKNGKLQEGVAILNKAQLNKEQAADVCHLLNAIEQDLKEKQQQSNINISQVCKKAEL